MKVRQIMTADVVTVGAANSLSAAARAMWENDVGVLPVVDSGLVVIGMLTDRDIAMSAWLQGRTLAQIPVSEVMARTVVSCRADDDVAEAARVMAERQVRRLAVTDAEGRLEGILSINDLAVSVADDTDDASIDEPRVDPGLVAGVLRAVCTPRDG